MSSKSRSKTLAALALVALAHGSAALAQGAAAVFPSKPIEFIVTSPPGGSNDVFARAIARRLGEALGTPVIVDNRSGATGAIGAALVAKAPADGHTLLMISSSFATSAAIQTGLPFDPIKSFVPVAMVGKGPLLLTVSPTLPVATTGELFALARSKPGHLNYATSGTGSINHFATELLLEAAGIRMTHVPYKGMGPAVTDLIAGHVDVLVASAPSIQTQVKAGRVKGLGVTTALPSPIAPGLPPVALAGAKDFAVELWWGVVTTAGTPRAVVARLNSEINKVLAGEEMKAFLAREGAEPLTTTPEAFAAVLREDIERWKNVARTAGIRAE